MGYGCAGQRPLEKRNEQNVPVERFIVQNRAHVVVEAEKCHDLHLRAGDPDTGQLVA